MKCAVTNIKILWDPVMACTGPFLKTNFVTCYISISTILLYTAMYLHFVKKFPLLYLVSSNCTWPTLSHLIFSKQHKCENLTSCNDTFSWRTFDFHSSMDENSYLLRRSTMLTVKQSYSSAILSKHRWLVKRLTSHSIPEDLNLTSSSFGLNITFSISDILNVIILTKIISFPRFWLLAYSSLNVMILPCLLSTSLMKEFNLRLGSLISCTHDSVILYLKKSCTHI